MHVQASLKTSPREPKNSTQANEMYLNLIEASLEDDKAEDIVRLDLKGKASFADYMVIATGLADRQIAAMASHLERKLLEAGLKGIKVEGTNGTDWVLLDAGDIIVHLFKAESRQQYGLEKMWGKEWDKAQENPVMEIIPPPYPISE